MIKIEPFDAAEFLTTVESQMELLTDAFDSSDSTFIAQALGVIAKARGMALSEKGDPRLSTLLGVAKALGLKLKAVPA